MAAFVTQPDTDDSKKFSHHTKVNSMVKTMFHLDTRHAVIDQVDQGASELWSEENLSDF